LEKFKFNYKKLIDLIFCRFKKVIICVNNGTKIKRFYFICLFECYLLKKKCYKSKRTNQKDDLRLSTIKKEKELFHDTFFGTLVIII
jgi:hypothetical protein